MELKKVKWFTDLKSKPRQGHTRHWCAVWSRTVQKFILNAFIIFIW